MSTKKRLDDIEKRLGNRYGDDGRDAHRLLDHVEADDASYAKLCNARMALRRGDVAEAERIVSEIIVND